MSRTEPGAVPRDRQQLDRRMSSCYADGNIVTRRELMLRTSLPGGFPVRNDVTDTLTWRDRNDQPFVAWTRRYVSK